MRATARKAMCFGLVALCSVAVAQPPPSPSEREQLAARMRALGQADAADEGARLQGDGVCVRIIVNLCREPETEVAAGLVRNGPQTQDESAPGKPSVVGFVGNNWPLAVEFEPEPGTFTVLRVKLFHQRYLFPYYEIADQRVLDPDGSGGRQTVRVDRLNLSGDPNAGDGIRVARIDVRSFRLVNGEVLRENGFAVRAPVTVFAIGAGPDVTGARMKAEAAAQFPSQGPPALVLASGRPYATHGGLTQMSATTSAFAAWQAQFVAIALHDVRIEPPGQIRIPPRNGHEQAGYSYALDRDFDAVATYIRPCQPLCAGLRQVGAPARGLANPHVAQTLSIDHRFRPGDYELEVRAWLQCGGASTPQSLAQCAGGPGWVMERARALRLVE